MKFRLVAGALLVAVLATLYLLYAADERPTPSAPAHSATADDPFRIVDR